MTSRTESYAVNHVQKFLDECCVRGSGHVSIGAMHKAYVLWCEARDVKHRRLDPVPFLAALEQDHGIVAGKCYWNEDGEERSAYALRGVRFRDGRLDRLRMDRERDGVGDSLNAHMSLTGRTRDETKQDDDGEPLLTEQQRKRRAYYLANKDKIRARRKAKR